MKKEILSIIAIVAALHLLCFGAVAIAAKMESATYNKLTGAQTTWWDAMWVELRVEAAVKP